MVTWGCSLRGASPRSLRGSELRSSWTLIHKKKKWSQGCLALLWLLLAIIQEPGPKLNMVSGQPLGFELEEFFSSSFGVCIGEIRLNNLTFFYISLSLSVWTLEAYMRSHIQHIFVWQIKHVWEIIKWLTIGSNNGAIFC